MRIECEDLAEDARGLTPGAGARNEIEGFVCGIDATQSTLRIGGITVQRTATTQIRRGALADLVNGAQVEVDGTRNASTITLLGTTVTLPSNATYRRADGTAFASLQAFLDAVVASPTGGTLVKVRGTPLSSRIEEAEIEN